MAYFHRTLERSLRRSLTEFPAVLVTGPRQAGKTTLLRTALADTHSWVSLEPPDVRASARSDPRGFLKMAGERIILDEVQYAPELLAYVKEEIDAQRGLKGRFVLSGSQNLLLLEQVSETLAGRVDVLNLLPLSRAEARGEPHAALPWESASLSRGGAASSPLDHWRSFLRGGYPELAVEPGRDASRWHSAYTQTYLERDVRALRQVGDLSSFRAFLEMLAARSAQILNLTAVARDLGVAVNTTKAWLGVLEATHQVIRVRPLVANVGKRLSRRPKVYFTDVGTLCHLVGLTTAEHAMRSPMSGAIVETAVVGEILRRIHGRGERARLHFWRTTAGTEVDLVVERGGRYVPIEVKQSATPTPRMARALISLASDLGEACEPGYVVHLGETRLPLGGGVVALPFHTF